MIAAICEYVAAGFAAAAALVALFPFHAIAAAVTCFVAGLGPGFWLGLAVRTAAAFLQNRTRGEK